MSNQPIDKRRARQSKRPWYVEPTTWKVVICVLQLVNQVIGLFE